MRRTDAQTLFVAGGIAASLLLLVFVLQYVVPAGRAVTETLPQPDFSLLLPASAVLTGTALEMDELPQPAYIVPFIRNGVANIALVSWNKEDARYDAGTPLARDAGAAVQLNSITSLREERIGSGDPIFVVTGNSGDEAEWTFLVVRGAAGLTLVQMSTEANDAKIPAFFRTSSKGAQEGTVLLSFDDANGDSRRDVLAMSGTYSGVMVWHWEDGALAFDKDLSRLLSMSRSIFPDPPPKKSE